MRVCLDTNVLVSGIFWKGIPGRILDLWADDHFDLVGTPSIWEEYRLVLRRLGTKFGQGLANEWARVLVEKMIIVVPVLGIERWVRDIHDDKFIQGSLAGRVDYLVTGDRDLLALEMNFPFEITKPREFLRYL